MNNIQMACYALIASAFVLAGLLVYNLGGQNQAQAGMVISEGVFSIMTAQTRENEESLFVLENNSATLLVYRLELRKQQLTLVGALPIGPRFANIKE